MAVGNLFIFVGKTIWCQDLLSVVTKIVRERMKQTFGPPIFLI